MGMHWQHRYTWVCIGSIGIRGYALVAQVYLGMHCQHRYTWVCIGSIGIRGYALVTQVYMGIHWQHRYTSVCIGIRGYALLAQVFMGMHWQHRYTWVCIGSIGEHWYLPVCMGYVCIMEMRVDLEKNNKYISMFGISIICLHTLMHDIIFDPSLYVLSIRGAGSDHVQRQPRAIPSECWVRRL